MYWLESFKRGDIEDVEYQRRIMTRLSTRFMCTMMGIKDASSC